jgi:PhnB protein
VISSDTDTDAEIAFLTTVFKGEEIPDPRMLNRRQNRSRQVELGDAVIMLFDAPPDLPPTPAHLGIYVASTERRSTSPWRSSRKRSPGQPTLPFGERVARVRDPQGHAVADRTAGDSGVRSR